MEASVAKCEGRESVMTASALTVRYFPTFDRRNRSQSKHNIFGIAGAHIYTTVHYIPNVIVLILVVY